MPSDANIFGILFLSYLGYLGVKIYLSAVASLIRFLISSS